jgi:serine protease Do
VTILIDDEPVGLGAVVDAQGLIVTKASFLKENILCRLSDGRSMEAIVVGGSNAHDMALLKVQATDLPVVDWRTETIPTAGTLLAAVGAHDEPLAIGVVGAEPRTVPGLLGAHIIPSKDGQLRIAVVEYGTAAEAAGLKNGDVIETVDDARARSFDEWRQALHKHERGTPLQLVITRGDDRKRRMQISVARFGSPAAILHDAMVRANASGGPLVDLEGKVVGINVADRHRRDSNDNVASNIAVPAADVRRIVAELRAQ